MLTPLQFFTASGGGGSWQQRWVECIEGGDRQRERDRGERKRGRGKREIREIEKIEKNNDEKKDRDDEE